MQVRWLGLNGHVLWSHPGAVLQLAAEAPRSSAVWAVGSRAARKPAADMLNEPQDWPLAVMALTQHKVGGGGGGGGGGEGRVVRWGRAA